MLINTYSFKSEPNPPVILFSLCVLTEQTLSESVTPTAVDFCDVGKYPILSLEAWLERDHRHKLLPFYRVSVFFSD